MNILFVTCPPGEAESLAGKLVEEKLVACVNIIPRIKSVYWWEDKIQNDEESLLVMKTTPDLVPTVIARVRELHSYEVPEVISLPIEAGNEAYLKWIGDVTRPTPTP